VSTTNPPLLPQHNIIVCFPALRVTICSVDLLVVLLPTTALGRSSAQSSLTMSTHSNNTLLLPDPLDWNMSLIEANIELAQIFDDFKDDEEHQEVKPGVGNTVRSAWWDAIEYVGQKLAGIFGRS
jgi:hypothetical protein